MSQRSITLQLHLKHGRPLVPASKVMDIANKRISEDSHGKRCSGSAHQVCLLDESTLKSLSSALEELCEPVTLKRFPDIFPVPIGSLLFVGESPLESSQECEPTLTWERYSGSPSGGVYARAG